MKFPRLFKRAPVAIPTVDVKAPPLTAPPLKISEGALEALRGKERHQSPFLGLPTPPPGVRPSAPPPSMAMDDATATPGGAIGVWAQGGLWGEGLFFPGYPYLAELAQRPEYRNISETVAEEMTRKWIKLVSTGDKDKTDKINRLEALMKKFGLREAFNRGMELDGFMGMGMVFIDLGDETSNDELKTPMIGKGKVEKGDLKAFTPIDPTWVSPLFYNSTDPLRADFLKPSLWYVMGKPVHESRLLIFRSREVPDILKASYNFGGLSLSQMAKPYVDNWLRTRQSVSDLLHAFTVFVLKTTLQSLLADGQAMMRRIAAFVMGRDNKGLMLIDKETEELDNVSAPITGLDKLQAQAQEQMASVSQEPLVKLLGITPSGLNASSDGEIRVWYDRVHAKQEKVFGPLITRALEVMQLSEFGEVDEEIGFEFVPLWQLDEAGKAAVEKVKADTDSVYLADGVISNEEVRTRLAGDPESPYHGLAGPAPEPEPIDGEVDKADIAGSIASSGAKGSEKGANSGV